MTAAPLLPEIKVEEQPPAERARAFLERDRLMAAYALADIDAAEIERARWWTATRDGETTACVLVVEALPFRPCFATGETEALAEIFREGIHEPRLVVATPPSGRIAVESVYRFERVDRMHRMAIELRRFRPRVTHQVMRLGPDRLEDVVDLYGHASRTSAVTEAAFEEHADVVLNVRQDNEVAIAVYQRLGYRMHGQFLEGPAVRRSTWDRI